MNNMNARDWFVMTLAGALWTASTVFLFKHPSEANFVTWSTFGGTLLAAYHWMVIRDQKVCDAGASQ